MAEKKVAIIGAGLGGLAAAIRLRILGFHVDVYEKNNSAGGKAGELLDRGFRFDTGPSLLTMPFVLQELFDFAGEDITDYIHLEKLDVLCKYFYADGTVIPAYSDVNKFVEEIERNTSDNSLSVLKYLNYCKNIYDLSAELFLFKSFTEWGNYLNLSALKTLFNIRKLDTHRTMHQANSSFFSDERTIQLFDRYATYNGSNPFMAPATLNIIQHVEYNLGGYISLDGIRKLPDSLSDIAIKKGVKFHYNANVERIIVKNKCVNGIKTDGVFKQYDIVVSNSDVENTYKNLLKDTHTRASKKYKKLEKSSSAVVFYWGIEGAHPDLEIHNIIFSENYRQEFADLFERKIIPVDPTVYIYISSKFKQDDAPANCENWFVMVNAPRNTGQDWNNEISKLRRAVLKKIKNILNLELDNYIVSENIMTPASIEENTGSMGGSIYGISSNNRMAAFLRQQNRSKDYKGLYFTGGSAHPGGGIPLVILSGKITSDLIDKYELS